MSGHSPRGRHPADRVQTVLPVRNHPWPSHCLQPPVAADILSAIRGRSGRSSRIWVNRSSRLPSLPPAARPPPGASSRRRTTIGRSFKRRPTSCPRSTSTASERCRTQGIKTPDGRPGRRSAPRREKRHSGGSAGVPGPADWVPESAAPASPAAHRLGNACGHGCGSAIDRTILRFVSGHVVKGGVLGPPPRTCGRPPC